MLLLPLAHWFFWEGESLPQFVISHQHPSFAMCRLNPPSTYFTLHLGPFQDLSPPESVMT